MAIVGALLSGSFTEKGVPIARPQTVNGAAQRTTNGIAAKKLLVCAPSNAAVDELVMRFKEGVKTVDGSVQKLSVIRLGRSDAINANVVDVTLEELVNAKWNAASGKKAGAENDIHKIMMAHKAASEELNTLRAVVDELKASGKPVTSEQDRDFEVLKRKKQQLSNQIDAARDSGNVAARDAELNRRCVQQDILNGAHVICATLSGSGHEMFQGLNIEFETVIIDEAAQSIELSALIPLKYGCSKCILVGDPKQLPPTVLSREAARFQYEQSLFVRMQSNHPQDVHLLDTQYRMHPEISVFPSNAFYDAKLLDGPGMANLRARPWHQSKVLSPYRFFDVQGQHQNAPRGHSLINLAEIDVAIKLFDRLITDCKGYDFNGKIGIITPYKSQLRELRGRFAQKYGDAVLASVEFNTTDAFQGRESEIIIFSCVRASFSKGIGFLSDIRRMNVGITRAKCSLWVLGNSKSLMQGEFWGRLIQDAKSRDRYTSGDLNEVFRKPLLGLDPKLVASNSAQSVTKTSNVTPSSDHDVEMIDASGLGASKATSRSRSENIAESPKDITMLDDADRMGYCPAGGSNGLNPNGNCQKCGSFEHYTHRCDNPDAKGLMGACFRCKGEGHSKFVCTVERCLTCGEFGHLQRICTSAKQLSRKERDRISRVEAEHKSFLQRAPEEKEKRQLGDHDKRVPMVRTTSTTPSPINASRIVPGQPEKTGEKRRRGSSPPVGAPKVPKIMKEVLTNGTAKALPTAPNRSQPLSKIPNGTMRRDRPGTSTEQVQKAAGSDLGERQPSSLAAAAEAMAANSSIDRPNELPVNAPSDASSMKGGTSSIAAGHAIPGQRGIGSGTIIELGQGPGAPTTARPPPPPNMVRPPKKKKQVDPFIRPKKRP